jgi:O-antigen/teichoic acid export membrane protein
LVEIKKELINLVRHTSIYGATELLSRFIGFIMIPFYTHYLRPTDYGISELVGLTIEVISMVLGMGISNAIYRFYYDKNEVGNSMLVISTAAVGVPILGFFTLAILSFFSNQIALLALGNKEYAFYLHLAIAELWFGQMLNLVYTYVRVTESSRIYAALSISRLIFSLSLNIFLIAGMDWGVLGLFVSNLISAALFTIFTFPLLLKKVGCAFSMEVGKKMLRYSLPIVPANLASLVVNASDRFFIRAFLSLADAGVYSLGYKLGNIVFYLVRVPFMQIWEPRRYALYQEGAPPEFFARVTTYFYGCMLFCGLGIAIFVQDIIKIITPNDYWNAAIYAPAIVVCYIVYALDHHVAFGILISKKTEYWTYVNLIMGAMNLLLNFVLISRYGVWGAIGATFIPLVFKICALYFVGRRFYRIPFEWPRMAGMFIIAAGIFFVSIMFHPSYLPIALFYDTVMILAFLPIIWISGLLHIDEKIQIKNLYQTLRRNRVLETT